jgi:beta-glucosidase
VEERSVGHAQNAPQEHRTHWISFMFFTRSLVTLPVVVALVVPAYAQTPTYKNAKAPLESRVSDLMSRLTPGEKLSLLAGTEFTTQAIPRLGIPPVVMADAGQGVRGGMESTLGPATAFPSGVAMASTWNPGLIGQVGAAIGVEAQNKGTGVQVMLGPAVNIQRSPLGGRNGEYFSEDPFLAGRLAVSYIRGMQGTGTVACIKHFAANNEEVDRFTVNVQVSERALREIYLPAFEAGVKDGGVWTVMSSYNRVNGPYASANGYLLTDILKRGWGFNGMVMSDWGGVHEAARVVNAGNDLEMPGRGFLSPAKVQDALARGLTTQAQVDANVTRIVRTIVRSGVVDGPKVPNPALVNSNASRDIALRAAQEGIVLLKNERAMLPFSTRIRSIALIGPGAKEMQIGAQGSPGVQPLRSVGPLEGLRARAGAGVQVRYVSGDSNGNAFPSGTLRAPSGEAGFSARYFAGTKLEGAPTQTRLEPQIEMNVPLTGIGNGIYSARWTSTFTPRKSGPTQFLFRADDGCRLFLDDKQIIDHWQNSAATTQVATVDLQAGQPHQLRAEYFQSGGNAVAQLRIIEPGSDPLAEVVEAARASDVAVVCVTTRGTEGEGQDRPSMTLPEGQDELVRRVVAANPRTVVVLNNGTPVSMPWLGRVPALVETWFPGQEGGRALAGVLFGDVNPSGHLPTTLGARREDYPDYPNFGGNGRLVRYEEGIYVGYRGFDKRGIAPLFPFGYGLSYTTFRIDNLKLSSPTLNGRSTAPTRVANNEAMAWLGTRVPRLTARVRVTNTGARAGAQVVQLYVSDPNPKTDKAVRELKGFSKVFLQPGQSQLVSLQLSPRDFAWCDVSAKGWRANAGNYRIEVGDSSRNLPQKATVRLADYFEPIPFMRDEIALPPRETAPDLALGKRAFASSGQDGEHRAALAFDDNIQTRWQGSSDDNQWLAVDLGQKQRIGRVHLSWEAAYASQYRIEVSDEGQNFRPVYSTDQSQGGEEDIAFAPVEARYVRVLALKRGTRFGASIQDFEVRAPK